MEAPMCFGITGDYCISCKQAVIDNMQGELEAPATSPLHMVHCHANDEFQCEDCLTKAWYDGPTDTVRCAWRYCGKDAGFADLPDIEGFIVSRELVDKTELLRFRKEIADRLITIRKGDGRVLLAHIYSYVADQLLDPTELGSLPSEFTENFAESAKVSMGLNPFFSVIHELFMDKMTSKLVMTPIRLEKQMFALLEHQFRSYVIHSQAEVFSAVGIDVHTKDGLDAAVPIAKDGLLTSKNLYDNWRTILVILVDLLCWRHLERFGRSDELSQTGEDIEMSG